MKLIHLILPLFILFTSASLAHEYEHVDGFPQVPESWKGLGDGHGEIAVTTSGEVFVSVQGGEKPGLQVYSKEGSYLRNIEGVPNDFHGFVIHQEKGGEYIYGVGLVSGTLSKLELDGKEVFSTPVSAIPEKFIGKKKGVLNPRFTSCDVAPDGTIYVVDGYGLDNIHVFNNDGSYRNTWIGRAKPYEFRNLHKLFVDLRYEEPRILCCDRANHRLVHISLEGEWIGEYATKLLRPSSAAFYGSNVAIAEIGGRISVLNLEGEIVSVMGTNTDKYNGNRTPPEKWREGIVTSPHGISYDADGNILMTEYSKFGRVLKFAEK